MAIHTHYDTLKVTRDAPAELIRAAYRVLSQLHHPDKHNGDPAKSHAMSLINASYNVLSNPDKRIAYDNLIAGQDRGHSRSTVNGSGSRASGPQTPPPRKPDPRNEETGPDADLMRKYGISRYRDMYAYGTYRFSDLQVAIRHARHVEQLRRGA